MSSNREHWDKIFSDTENSKLGWWENDTSKTFELLNMIPNWMSSKIFISGVGTSNLADALLEEKATLVLNDISQEALDKLKIRLALYEKQIEWLCHDISKSIEPLVPVDIWIDRAVLHFFNNEADIEGYFNNVKSMLKIDGYAIFAEFSKTGAPKCAGLPLNRYSAKELSQRLGSSFELVNTFDHTFINPEGGERPYIYALYKKTKI